MERQRILRGKLTELWHHSFDSEDEEEVKECCKFEISHKTKHVYLLR